MGRIPALAGPLLRRHGRACPGHLRLACSAAARKTWMPATSAGMTLELRPARERGNDVVEHVLPPAGVTLAKQKHRRIPRGVAAALHPAPVAVGRQEGPYGPAERAGKVRHHGVD